MKKIALLLILASTSLFANDLLQPKEIKQFYGATKNLGNNPLEIEITKPLVKVDECLSVIKNGESFWTNTETDIFHVESIGDSNIKLKRLMFLSKKSNKWTYDKFVVAIPFQNQNQFEITKCPSISDKLSNEEVELILKK